MNVHDRLDAEWLAELNYALECADERSEGQRRWQARASVKQPHCRDYMREVMTECRTKAKELRAMAERLEAGADHMAELVRV